MEIYNLLDFDKLSGECYEKACNLHYQQGCLDAKKGLEMRSVSPCYRDGYWDEIFVMKNEVPSQEV